MKRRNGSDIKTLGLFEKRLEGDDSLMQLARRRFSEARMGTEIHGGTPEQLEAVLQFRPNLEAPVVVHLPRDFDLLEESSRESILRLAQQLSGRVYGLVLHDHKRLPQLEKDYVAAAWALEEGLENVRGCPFVFVEYAAGLSIEEFAHFLSAIRDLDHLSACLDIGHIGMRYARASYAQAHEGADICTLKSQGPELPALMPAVESAVSAGATAALEAVEAIAAFNKPVHFHLHDGHPLSTFSPFGVSDHLSFQAEIPLKFEYKGLKVTRPMFGPGGLRKIIAKACSCMQARPLSFTLEIHPTGERTPLGDTASLFGHWRDKSNAEKMNHWLTVLRDNHVLLTKAIEAALPPLPRESKPDPVAPPEGGVSTPGPEFVSGACDI